MTNRISHPWILCPMLALACAGGAQADLSVMHHYENPVEIAPGLPGTPIDLIGGDGPQPRPQARTPQAPPLVVPMAVTDADPTLPAADVTPVPGALPKAPAIKSQVVPPIIMTVPADAPKPPVQVQSAPVVKVSETRALPAHQAATYAPSSPDYVVLSTIVSPFSGLSATATPLTPWIFFDSGATVLSLTSFSDLDQIGQTVRGALSDPAVHIVVTGYTDSTGTAETNQRIATERARSVARALSERFGLPPSRIVARGAGEDLARVSSAPHSGVHRRVEVMVVRERRTGSAAQSDARCVMTGPYGGAPVKGRLVASTFESIDDYGGGRLTEYCDFTTHSD